MDFSLKNITALRSIPFDILYNLDKDIEACALAEQITSKIKKGFTLVNGKAAPINDDAAPKFMTGLFDDVSKSNTKSYLEEIFEMCGFKFQGEKYLLDKPTNNLSSWKINKKKTIVGLNTGCGSRWTSRLWAEKNWISLTRNLKKKGFEVVLLGGEEEDKKNKKIAKQSGVKYFGHFPLKQFIALIDCCDLVVTGVTMAMHITIGLGKKIVLLNNIFNRNEFELYGLGEIVEPKKPCKCYFQPVCTNSEYKCMEHLSVKQVLDSCLRLSS
jgi:heptosyltransferase-2